MVPGLTTRDLQVVELRRRDLLREAARARHVADVPVAPRSRPLATWARNVVVALVSTALPRLARKPSEYIRGPQYFQSIQLYEGEQSLRHAIEALGEDTLMFATDYPHS